MPFKPGLAGSCSALGGCAQLLIQPVNELRTGDLPLQITALQQLYLDKRLAPAVAQGLGMLHIQVWPYRFPVPGDGLGGDVPRLDRAIRQDALIKGDAFLQPRLFLRGGLGQLGLQLCQLGLVFPIAGALVRGSLYAGQRGIFVYASMVST